MRDCRFKVSKFSFLILKKGNVGAIMILNLNKRLFKYMNEYKALGAQFGNVFMCSIIWNQNFSWSDELKLWKFHENFSRRGMPNDCFQSSIKPFYQYTAQVVLGRGDNRAASYFLPELFSEGSKAVKGSMDVLPFDELSQVRKIPFSRYLKNRINFNNSRRKLRIIPFFAELFAL